MNELGAPRDAIVGQNGGMRQVLADIEKVARTDANVLITGENGTGKELVARADPPALAAARGALRGRGSGRDHRVAVRIRAVRTRKGAFTDAREDRAGRFEAAAGGTLFLDEIGNSRFTMQAKLLGALATMTVTRVGSDKPVTVDARVICATNLTAEQLRDPERFRPDLLYRVNTIEIHIPPLRERPRIFRCWWRTSRSSMRASTAGPSLRSPRVPWRGCSSTAGPAMCANSSMRWNAR